MVGIVVVVVPDPSRLDAGEGISSSVYCGKRVWDRIGSFRYMQRNPRVNC